MKKVLFLLLAVTTSSLAFNTTLKAQSADQTSRKDYNLVTIGNKSGGDISKTELLNSGELTLKNGDDSGPHVSSFRMELSCGDKSSEFINRKDSNKLTDEMRTAIYHAEKGCKVYFEYIGLMHKNNSIQAAKPLSFNIVE